MEQLTILGATGSIGRQTLDVVRSNPDRYRAACLTTNAGVIARFLGDRVELRELGADDWLVTVRGP